MLVAASMKIYPPPRATLTYFVNQYPQTLSCPLEFCTYEKKSCKDVTSIVNHFRKSHPCFHLYVNYHCQRCHIYVDPAERLIHIKAHLDEDCRQIPFSPPVPVINPTDNSLSFQHQNDAGEAVDEIEDLLVPDTQSTSACSPSQPDEIPPSPAMENNEEPLNIQSSTPISHQLPDPASISVHVADSDLVDLLQSPVDSTDTIDSNLIIASKPTPQFLDPSSSINTTPSPKANTSPSNNTSPTARITSEIQDLDNSPEDVSVDHTPLLPSQLTPEFIEPTSSMESTNFLCVKTSDSTSELEFEDWTGECDSFFKAVEALNCKNNTNDGLTNVSATPATTPRDMSPDLFPSPDFPKIPASPLSLSPADSPSERRTLLFGASMNPSKDVRHGCSSPDMFPSPNTVAVSNSKVSSSSTHPSSGHPQLVDEKVLKKDYVKSCKRAVDALKSVLKDSGSESDSTPDLIYSASSPNEANLIKSRDANGTTPTTFPNYVAKQ